MWNNTHNLLYNKDEHFFIKAGTLTADCLASDPGSYLFELFKPWVDYPTSSVCLSTLICEAGDPHTCFHFQGFCVKELWINGTGGQSWVSQVSGGSVRAELCSCRTSELLSTASLCPTPLHHGSQTSPSSDPITQKQEHSLGCKYPAPFPALSC